MQETQTWEELHQNQTLFVLGLWLSQLVSEAAQVSLRGSSGAPAVWTAQPAASLVLSHLVSNLPRECDGAKLLVITEIWAARVTKAFCLLLCHTLDLNVASEPRAVSN